MGKIKFILFFLLAPLLGMVIGFYNDHTVVSMDAAPVLMPIQELHTKIDELEVNALNLQKGIGSLQNSLDEEERFFQEQKKLLQELTQKSLEQKEKSDAVYEEMIISRLGNPIEVYSSKNVEILIFAMKKEGLRGYMAKVKLKNPEALKVVLAPENKENGEKTSTAVKRVGGIFGVNGGGFWNGIKNGSLTMVSLGNTIIKGKLINGFAPSYNDLFFAGFTKEGKLVGGVYKKEEDLRKTKAWQGVSFVPILIRDWKPLEIPQKWAKQRQPRTVVGQYPNGDLFFIVVDGRQSSWSKGITLEEMQVTLMRLGVMEAFNLDGGGSSSFVYNGKVLNKPSDGNERNVITNIIITP